jgi:hypothetical protein
MALTRTRLPAASFAATFVSWIRPAFDAAYAATPGSGFRPAAEAVVTIDPPSRIAFKAA